MGMAMGRDFFPVSFIFFPHFFIFLLNTATNRTCFMGSIAVDQYTFPGLSGLLDSVNRKRAENGENPINKKDWSAFLSGVGGAQVRKAWLTSLLNGQGISRDKAWNVLSAINAVLKQTGLPTAKANELIQVQLPSE